MFMYGFPDLYLMCPDTLTKRSTFFLLLTIADLVITATVSLGTIADGVVSTTLIGLTGTGGL